MPSFAHVSLILAPNRSKLSKCHGATSVGQVTYQLFSISNLYQHILFYTRMKSDISFSLHSIKRWAIYLRQWSII
jgi:glutamyl/glutaminyl-tRNA synthetase